MLPKSLRKIAPVSFGKKVSNQEASYRCPGVWRLDFGVGGLEKWERGGWVVGSSEVAQGRNVPANAVRTFAFANPQRDVMCLCSTRI